MAESRIQELLSLQASVEAEAKNVFSDLQTIRERLRAYELEWDAVQRSASDDHDGKSEALKALNNSIERCMEREKTLTKHFDTLRIQRRDVIEELRQLQQVQQPVVNLNLDDRDRGAQTSSLSTASGVGRTGTGNLNPSPSPKTPGGQLGKMRQAANVMPRGFLSAAVVNAQKFGASPLATTAPLTQSFSGSGPSSSAVTGISGHQLTMASTAASVTEAHRFAAQPRAMITVTGNLRANFIHVNYAVVMKEVSYLRGGRFIKVDLHKPPRFKPNAQIGEFKALHDNGCVAFLPTGVDLPLMSSVDGILSSGFKPDGLDPNSELVYLKVVTAQNNAVRSFRRFAHGPGSNKTGQQLRDEGIIHHDVIYIGKREKYDPVVSDSGSIDQLEIGAAADEDSESEQSLQASTSGVDCQWLPEPPFRERSKNDKVLDMLPQDQWKDKDVEVAPWYQETLRGRVGWVSKVELSEGGGCYFCTISQPQSSDFDWGLPDCLVTPDGLLLEDQGNTDIPSTVAACANVERAGEVLYGGLGVQASLKPCNCGGQCKTQLCPCKQSNKFCSAACHSPFGLQRTRDRRGKKQKSDSTSGPDGTESSAHRMSFGENLF